MRHLLVALASCLLVLTGCASSDDASGTDSGMSASAGASGLLAAHGLDGKSVTEVIDLLDRLPQAERPTDLMASVRPTELVVSSDGEEHSLEVPDDRFYLSVAPYADQTHECFYHSLTTCKGELSSADIEVELVDETNGKVLVDEVLTTFDNGFVGFWLPRDIEGTLRVAHDGKVGETSFSTDGEAPTCLTTLQLA